jgi:hypothetical protein
MLGIRIIALGSLWLAAATLPLAAQQSPVTVKEEKPGLFAQAKITPDSATRVAQARLPAATIQAAEIEVEDGHLLYSFDMQLANQPGIEEVQVDAKTGKVLGVEHEDAAGEAREKQADSSQGRP